MDWGEAPHDHIRQKRQREQVHTLAKTTTSCMSSWWFSTSQSRAKDGVGSSAQHRRHQILCGDPVRQFPRHMSIVLSFRRGMATGSGLWVVISSAVQRSAGPRWCRVELRGVMWRRKAHRIRSFSTVSALDDCLANPDWRPAALFLFSMRAYRRCSCMPSSRPAWRSAVLLG